MSHYSSGMSPPQPRTVLPMWPKSVTIKAQDCLCHRLALSFILQDCSNITHSTGRVPIVMQCCPCLCPGLSLSQLKIFPVKAQNCPCHSPGQIPSHVKLSPYSPGLSHHRPELSYNSPRLSTSQTVSVTACDCPPAPQSPGVSPSKSRLSQS